MMQKKVEQILAAYMTKTGIDVGTQEVKVTM
jgi:hypothetical protein